MKKAIVLLALGFSVVFANGFETKLTKSVLPIIQKEYKECLKEGVNLMKCDRQRQISLSELRVLDYKEAYYVKNKADKIKKEALSKEYKMKEEDQAYDLLFSECSKAADTQEEQRMCFKKTKIQKESIENIKSYIESLKEED